jgi:hypothetical protein
MADTNEKKKGVPHIKSFLNLMTTTANAVANTPPPPTHMAMTIQLDFSCHLIKIQHSKKYYDSQPGNSSNPVCN